MAAAPPEFGLPRARPDAGMRTFGHVLVNTAIANVTTSYLWFALTFWVYLQTRSVLATGIIGGSYMLFVSVSSVLFGTLVDRHRKHAVMLASSALTLLAFAAGGVLYLLVPQSDLLTIGGPWFWLFIVIVLFGAVVEHMRNIALSTVVTLLVAPERRANANGLVGTVQGIAFIVTSVFSGLSIGFLGMGWTIAIAVALTALAAAHLLTIRIPETEPGNHEHTDTADIDLASRAAAAAGDPDQGGDGEALPGKAASGQAVSGQGVPGEGAEEGPSPPTSLIDLSGAYRAVLAAPGLFALIIFSTLNNLIGGVYMALMDPYGLELFPVQTWGLVFGLASTGFIVGGLVVAKTGLGPRPMRTLLLAVAVMGVLGSLFTIREWWWLYALGIWLYMLLIPAVEAAEQTVIQRVVPYRTQGRVFGFAMMFETAAAPITAFAIAPLAEFWIIPWVDSPAGEAQTAWLLGTGDARGIALIFLFAGLALTLIALLAFRTRAYATLTEQYAAAPRAA